MLQYVIPKGVSDPYFHVSKTEFSQLALDHESITLKGSQDRVLTFGIYHELHCLNIIRKRMHLDYYGVSSSKRENGYEMWHAGALSRDGDLDTIILLTTGSF